MESIEQMIKTALSAIEPVVLAMIVRVDGSAYRREGTWMLIQKDGTRIGVISGGCLENDLHHRASELFHTGKAEIVQYDLSAEDDLGWGRGAGCNGVVSILIRDIDPDFHHFLSIMYQRLLAREPVLYLQSINNVDNYAFLNKREHYLANWHEEIPIKLNTLPPFQNKVGQIIANEQNNTTFFQLIWPQPTLFIIGDGADARPLARLASHAGYKVHLYGQSSEHCTAKYFPTVASIQVGNVSERIGDVTFTSLDSVVIMTHDFQIDEVLLQQLRTHRLLYLGVLGSKQRTERLFGGAIPPGVYSPVGLSIKADGPEEIAISIMAELIAVRRGKSI